MFKSIYELISSQDENRIALESSTGIKLSYKNLRKKVDNVVKLLQYLKLENERIAIILPNGLGAAFAFLSVSSSAVSAPLNPNFKKKEFEFYLIDLKIKAILIEQNSQSPVVDVAKALGLKIIELCSPNTNPNLIVSKINRDEPCLSEEDRKSLDRKVDLALLLHTSGTTGKPKIVPLTQGNLCASVENISRSLGLNSSDRGLNIMPLFHIHGIVASLLSPLSRGGTVICSNGFDALNFFQTLIDCKPTFFSAVPTMYQLILDRGTRHNSDFKHTLKFIRSSSASMPEVLKNKVENFFKVPLLEAYGMTEASHQIVSNTIFHSRKMGSVGKIESGQVGIVSSANKILGNNLLGEVVIKGGNVTSGYENNPNSNKESIVNDWFKTGDQGLIDSDGYLFLKGRLKEIINKGGEKVSPIEIDNLVMSHPDVFQAVTFAISHPKLGEEIAVAVVSRGNKKIEQSELKNYCLERIIKHKVPGKIIFVKEIPNGPTGKPVRNKLASLLRI